jgi:hypothetical protein
MRLPVRNRPPAAVLAVQALLERDDRVLSWALTVEGNAVVASRFGLWWPEPGRSRLINWERIDKATWKDDTVTVIEADLVDDLLLVDREPVSASLAAPRDLPPTIRRRVQSGVVASELVAGGGVSMRVVGRRVPGRDGVSWWARLEPGVPDIAPTREIVHDVLDARRAQQSALERQHLQ